MNAADMTARLAGVSGALTMPFYQSLPSDSGISFSEFSATSQNISAVVGTLRNAPSEKIEAMVARYAEDLTAHFDEFDAAGQQHPVAGFRTAQIIAGFVATIMAKSGVGIS